MKDRRNKLVYLTEKGEEFHQWIAPQLKEYYDRLERILGKEQIKLTDKLLKDLQHAIETY
jgi:DNA-binding MarR family transcriptional regulator